MKTLYEKQKEAFDFFIDKQTSGSNTLDTSHVGTGKTIVACHLAKELDRPVAVLCPKAVIPSWERELAECGIKPLFVLNYEKIRTGRTDFMSKRGKKIMKWHLPEGTLMLVDEVHKCLPHGTLVAMADGSKKQIQRVRVGDKVATPIGPKSVTHRVRSGHKKCLIVKTEKGTIVSSDEHRIYTKKGWVQAKELTTEDSVFVRGVPEASLGSELPQLPKGTRKGCEEGQAFGGEWLESPPTEEQGRLCGGTSKVLQVTELESELVCYDIEVEDAKCFYAEDILVHNCKGPYTQNAQLLISLVTQGYSVHAMSATTAEDPTEMRPIGFALGLHNLNKTEGDIKSWYSWMMQYGCLQNDWGAWELSRRSKLSELNKVMYAKNVKRLTVDDFPDSFKANRVFVEPVAFTSAAKIAKAYEKLGITPEIIENYLLTGSVEDSDWLLVNLLRARQLAESLKAKDMADMAKDYAEQGNSVVMFVNFSDTAEVLSGLLDCPAIVGGQSAEERQQIVDDFQADKQHVIVVNIAAGGTGISLHDTNGNRQRISLISPTFNVKDHLQALGRIHRNGAKSDAIQKILVADGSIEEHVMRVIEQKTSNLNTLHQ